MATALFLILNWVLYLIFNESATTYERVMYYGVATAITIPMPFLVGFDMHRRCDLLFQIPVAISVWFWGVSEGKSGWSWMENLHVLK